MNPDSFNNPAANSQVPNQNYRPIPTAPLNPTPVRMDSTTSGAGKIIKTILLIFFVLTTLIAGYFVYYYYREYTIARTDIDAQIAEAVAKAEKDKTSELEAEFAEREKSPYSTFSGPADYGELTFNYPKTWSVYIEKDAIKGGDFVAYLNPGVVNPISKTTINSLRVTISTSAIDTVTKTYQKLVDKGQLTAETTIVNGETALRYTGTFSDGQHGSAVLFKLRDKTVTLRTDAEIFFDDFNHILETVKYNS